jgi:hypothetical protein
MNFPNLNLFNKTIVIVATENQTIFEIYDNSNENDDKKNECIRYEVSKKIDTIKDLKDIQPKDKKEYSCILHQSNQINNTEENENPNKKYTGEKVKIDGGFTKKKQPRDKYGRFIKNITYKNRKK